METDRPVGRRWPLAEGRDRELEQARRRGTLAVALPMERRPRWRVATGRGPGPADFCKLLGMEQSCAENDAAGALHLDSDVRVAARA